DEVHVADEVTSLESPLTVVPVAVNMMVLPVAESRETGETVILAIESPEEKKPGHPASNIKPITATTKRPFRAKCTALPPGDLPATEIDRMKDPDLHLTINFNVTREEWLRG